MINKVPILVTAYNRPLHLEVCLGRLKNVTNPIYISIDGAKSGNLKDKQLVLENIEIARSFLGSDHNLFINKDNLGLCVAVSAAISKVLAKHETIIVLEDDILLSDDAIYFYEKCLERYEKETSIAGITSINYVPKEILSESDAPYRLSNYAESWGWATWANRWEIFDYGSLKPLSFRKVPIGIRSISTWLVWRNIFEEVSNGSLNSWAYRWMYYNWQAGRKFLVSNQNLSTNIGFGDSATNTTQSIYMEPVTPLRREVLLTWPEPHLNTVADLWLTKKHFKTNFSSRIHFFAANRLPSKVGQNKWT